jgi:hypothetical protein
VLLCEVLDRICKNTEKKVAKQRAKSDAVASKLAMHRRNLEIWPTPFVTRADRKAAARAGYVCTVCGNRKYCSCYDSNRPPCAHCGVATVAYGKHKCPGKGGMVLHGHQLQQ